MARRGKFKTKAPGETVDYGIDWSERLGSDTITSSTWTINGPDSALTSTATNNTTDATEIRLTGGTLGKQYDVKNTVVTFAGERFEQTALFEDFNALMKAMLLLATYLAMVGVGMAEEHKPLSQEGEHPGGVIKLTRPDGTAIYVNPNAVAFIRGPLPGERGETTVTFGSGAKQTVLESVDEIGKIMDAERNDDGP